MSGNTVLSPVLYVLHIFLHLISKSNQTFKVHVINSIFTYKDTKDQKFKITS